METTNEKIYLTEDFFKKECLREFYSMKEFVSSSFRGFKVMSWGANSITNINNKLLRFKVQGHHFKGLVWIGVNGLDLFNVYFSKGRRSENGCYELVETMTDVYLEDIIDRIDVRVEKIKDYVR